MHRKSALLPRVRLGDTKHTMIGPGGKIVEPKSESAVLDSAITRLMREAGSASSPSAHRDLWGVIHDLRALREQVAGGYHRNPRKGASFSAGEVVGKIGDDVHDIRYTHAQDGKDYEHEFSSGQVEAWAVVRNGKREILLSHARGEPLWDDF